MSNPYRKLARDHRRFGTLVLAVMPALMTTCAVLNGLAAASGSGTGYWVIAAFWAASIPAWVCIGLGLLRAARTYERAADLWPH